ncbi:MAG: hypothetical protein KatS3mg062_0777 [Tepidiforma sp.]|nr:MAG: hypothetical protein KatS3mg062_0777 [Tepidiforma sp.]
MGGRKLPHPRALAALIALLPLLAGGCSCGGQAVSTPTVPAASLTAVTPTPLPTPTPTPDPIGPPPGDLAAARAALDRLDAALGPCNPAVADRWNTSCLRADIDGDLAPDAAVLLPLQQSAPVGPHPGAVLVSLSTAPGYVALSPPGAADTSILGRAVFSIADRDGLPRPEVAFLENLCTASRCASLVRVYTWDGSAWRDIGPADEGVVGIDRVTLEGTGASSAIVLHTRPSASPASGPIRGGTYRYTLRDGRFSARDITYDPPEYLFHAILDADALFARGLWEEAIAAYEQAIANPSLRDWKAETDRGESRSALVTYALLRIAIAAAADGRDANPFIDRVILEGKEPVFLNAAEAFRKGYQERGSVVGGCLEVTRYLAITGPGVDTPGYVQRLMDHGYANPRYTYRDICPL